MEFFVPDISSFRLDANLLLITFIVLLVNIPFGMWRKSAAPFSSQWFLAIHLPVPLIVLLRLYGNIGFALPTYFFLIGAFVGGQRIGATIYLRYFRTQPEDNLPSPPAHNEHLNPSINQE